LKAFGFAKINDIAVFYGKTEQNINGFINRNTLLRLVTPELEQKGINMDWVKNGQGEMKASPSSGAPPADLATLVMQLKDQVDDLLKERDSSSRRGHEAYSASKSTALSLAKPLPNADQIEIEAFNNLRIIFDSKHEETIESITKNIKSFVNLLGMKKAQTPPATIKTVDVSK
jgi:hypothetical protein